MIKHAIKLISKDSRTYNLSFKIGLMDRNGLNVMKDGIVTGPHVLLDLLVRLMRIQAKEINQK